MIISCTARHRTSVFKDQLSVNRSVVFLHSRSLWFVCLHVIGLSKGNDTICVCVCVWVCGGGGGGGGGVDIM